MNNNLPWYTDEELKTKYPDVNFQVVRDVKALEKKTKNKNKTKTKSKKSSGTAKKERKKTYEEFVCFDEKDKIKNAKMFNIVCIADIPKYKRSGLTDTHDPEFPLIKRYVITDEEKNILFSSHGYGFKSEESAKKYLRYIRKK